MPSNRSNRRRANKGTPPICASKPRVIPIPPGAILSFEVRYEDTNSGYYQIIGHTHANHPFYPVGTTAVGHFQTVPFVATPWQNGVNNYEHSMIQTYVQGRPLACTVTLQLQWPSGEWSFAHATLAAPISDPPPPKEWFLWILGKGPKPNFAHDDDNPQ
jgi:hypothetical protein